MLGHIKETDLSVPELIDGYYYHNRTEKGKQYPIFCRKRGSLAAREEVLLDENAVPRARVLARRTPAGEPRRESPRVHARHYRIEWCTIRVKA